MFLCASLLVVARALCRVVVVASFACRFVVASYACRLFVFVRALCRVVVVAVGCAPYFNPMGPGAALGLPPASGHDCCGHRSWVPEELPAPASSAGGCAAEASPTAGLGTGLGNLGSPTLRASSAFGRCSWGSLTMSMLLRIAFHTPGSLLGTLGSFAARAGAFTASGKLPTPARASFLPISPALLRDGLIWLRSGGTSLWSRRPASVKGAPSWGISGGLVARSSCRPPTLMATAFLPSSSAVAVSHPFPRCWVPGSWGLFGTPGVVTL